MEDAGPRHRPPLEERMDILVINLMRFGDLIQSTPLLRGLKARFPRARLTLVVQDIFRETAALLQPLDRLAAFPSLELSAVLEGQGWPAACGLLTSWLRANLPGRPHLAINLTPTPLAALLARVSNAPLIRGLSVGPQRELATWPAWASYSLVVAGAREANPFNVADLFVRVAGLAPDGRGVAVALPEATRKEAGERAAALGLPAGTARIGLVPGASGPERQWPPASFARAAQLLAQTRPCHFLLFGSAKERQLGEAVKARLPAGAATLLAGETGIQDLAGWLAALDLLITNDTGPMHLGAAVGPPVLGIFLAGARVWDTGPAGKGHVTLEPQLPCHPCRHPCRRLHCHEAVSPEVVASLAREMLAPAGRRSRRPGPEWEKVKVYQSAIDPCGHQFQVPWRRRPFGREDLWLFAHRLAWEQLLAGPAAARPLFPWLKVVLQKYYLPPREDLGVQESQRALAELRELARRGEEHAARIRRLAAAGPLSSLTAAGIKRQLAHVETVDQGLRRLGASSPELTALVDFFFQDQRVQNRQDPASLAEALGGAYAMLRRGAKLLAGIACWLLEQAAPAAWREKRFEPIRKPAPSIGRRPRAADTSRGEYAYHRQ